MALISPLYDQGDFTNNLKEVKLFNSLKKKMIVILPLT